jgi:hemerythrin superfamily protein
MTANKVIADLDAKSESVKGDVINLIKADHKKVDALFAEYESSEKSADKMLLLEKVVNELNVHTAAEEKLVYPSLEKEDKDGATEAYEEHHVVENMLQELMKVTEIDDTVDAKMKVLSELVKHHVKEEETKLLPEMKQSGLDLNKMGQEFKAGKEELKGKSLKPGQANTKAKAFKRKAG